MSEAVVELENVTVTRDGCAVLSGLSWTLREGQAWAVTGPTGSGKTTLAEVILGRHCTPGGEVRWPLLDRLRASGREVDYPSQVIKHVAFKEESRLFTYSGHYYQQRFDFADRDEPLSLHTFLRTHTNATDAEVLAVAERLGVREQLPQPFITLSNGQTRRARLARALLSHPELLILDDPFIGLDSAGLASLSELLGELVRDGKRLVLICRSDLVPAWATDVLECGTRNAERGVENQEVHSAAAFTPHSALRVPRSVVIELRDVVVSHSGTRILDGITWTVHAGERWAVVGPNGSGKTTLLSLLCGDHPQAYANDIRLFGRQRGSGESIWDVKRNVGFVSPEFHLYFTEPLTAERAAATGFSDSLADEGTTPAQDGRVRELFAAFRISHLTGRRFRELSTGEQRLVLLVRAVVKQPPLLILDEPFQGLDVEHLELCRAWLDRELTDEQTLLFVTHELAELPRCVNRTLRLDRGRVVGERCS